jgi:hypothetical protein
MHTYAMFGDMENDLRFFSNYEGSLCMVPVVVP